MAHLKKKFGLVQDLPTFEFNLGAYPILRDSMLRYGTSILPLNSFSYNLHFFFLSGK